MDWLTIEHFVSKGQAFLPVNAVGKGDIVQLIYQDGSTQLIDVQAQTFLKHVLSFFGTDLLSLRRRYGRVIGKKQLVPLPLSKQWTLVPFNTREAIGRQTRTGWIVFSKIQHLLEKNPHQTTIQLHEYSVMIYHSERFTFEQLRNAKLVEVEFEQIHSSPLECREISWTYFNR